MSSIVLTSLDVLEKLELSVSRKSQKANDCYNYFFSPSLSIRLYKPSISVVNKDYIVFKYDKYYSSGLYHYLESISERLYALIGRFYNTKDLQKDNILLVNENSIYLKAHLPHKNNRYFISVHNTDTNTLSNCFVLPNTNAVYDEVVVDIRNVWQYKGKLGFRLELKYVSV